jgi:tRNA A-37 threonylcarbamoyl transferase component Bud32
MILLPKPKLIARRNGNVSWQALADWEPVLFGTDGLRLQQWHSQGRICVVQHAAHRTVSHVAVQQGAFYVKQYRRDGFLDAAGHLVRPSAARREWRNLAEVARRGIPTARPLAWAEHVRGGLVRDNYLITEAIEPACSLEHYLTDELPRLPPNLRRTVRRRIAQSTARFVAAIHQAGVAHQDFHAGNVLVRAGPCGGDDAEGAHPDLYLIDLPGVRFSGPLDWPASRASLSMLAARWWAQTTRTERLRFWRTYLAQRPDLDLPDQRAAIRQLENGCREYSRRVTRRRDRRALRTNRDYVSLDKPNASAHGVADLARSELVRLMEAPELLLERNLDRPVKLGHNKLIVRAELPLADGPLPVSYARYRPRNRWKAFWGRFRRSRALRGWYMGNALRARGIATPRPLAVCQVRPGWFCSESYLATEWIDGSENLHLYGWRLAGLNKAERLRRAAACAESLGKLVGRMHACGISHGDLKASNVLVVERGTEIETYFIDAEDVRIARRLRWRRRVRDLARLATSIEAHPWVTPSILCRFLRAYVGQLRPGAVAWRPLWREVTRRSRRLVRRKRRRGREVL